MTEESRVTHRGRPWFGAAFVVAMVVVGGFLISRRSDRSGFTVSDQHLVVAGVPRGAAWTGRYVITNEKWPRIVVNVLAKSCTCIDASIDRYSIHGGESATVTIRTAMPVDGYLSGNLLLEITVMDVDDKKIQSEKLALAFSGSAEMSPGLTVLPETYLVPTAEWVRGFERKAMLVLKRESGAVGSAGSEAVASANARIVPRGDWKRLDASADYRRVAVGLPALDANQRRIVLTIITSGTDSTVTAQMAFEQVP